MNNKGFTLIELLVVITIIGILSIGGFTQTSSYLAKARDSQRQKGMSELYSALNTYQLDSLTAEYPDAAANLNTELVVGGYITTLPADPKEGLSSGVTGQTYGMNYAAAGSEEDPSSSAAFEVSVHFEAKQMRKRWHEQDEVLKAGTPDPNRYERSSLNEASGINTAAAEGRIAGATTTP